MLPGPGINCTGPREVLLEIVILIFLTIFMKKFVIVEIFWGEKYSLNLSKTQTQMLAWGNWNMLQDFISPVVDKKFKCKYIFVNMPHRTHIVLTLFMIMQFYLLIFMLV